MLVIERQQTKNNEEQKYNVVTDTVINQTTIREESGHFLQIEEVKHDNERASEVLEPETCPVLSQKRNICSTTTTSDRLMGEGERDREDETLESSEIPPL